MIRENRLYQADWLMRFYGFKAWEILTPEEPLLDMQIDPKLNWALNNLNLFPLDINKADYMLIMRVPGIGIQSAKKICEARKHRKLGFDHLKTIGISLNKAKHFIIADKQFQPKENQPWKIKQIILAESKSKYQANFSPQLKMF